MFERNVSEPTSCSTCGRDGGTFSLSFRNVFWITNRDSIDKLFTLMKAHGGNHHVCCLCGGRVHLWTEDVTRKQEKLHEMSLCSSFHSDCVRVVVFVFVLPPSSRWLSDWWCVYEGGRQSGVFFCKPAKTGVRSIEWALRSPLFDMRSVGRRR